METLTRKEQIKKVLEEKGRALTIDELVQFTGIPKNKLRQSLTTWEYKIVRVGHQIYDLTERVYPGKTFRYTPQKEEIEKGILSSDEDVNLFLTAAYDYNAKINLIDDKDKQYFSANQSLKKWYKKYSFEYGDDILFTCLDFKQKTFKITHQKRKDRDEFMIKVKNKKLADQVYDILVHTIPKYENYLFLVRKYLFIFPFNDPLPPDHLKKALWNDKRFLISTRDKMLSWTGKRLTFDFDIGLKKYYFQNEKGEYVLVEVLNDECGKYGFCTLCGERLKWSKEKGWEHIPEIDWAGAYLDNEFFKQGKGDN